MQKYLGIYLTFKDKPEKIRLILSFNVFEFQIWTEESIYISLIFKLIGQ